MLLFFVLVPALAQSDDLSGKVAFVNLTTVQRRGADQGVFAPRVLVRFRSQSGNSQFLAMTDQYGTATIPIEAGTYCADAFGLDGHPARLSSDSIKRFNRCFVATPGKVIEFSLTLAADAKYGGTIPSSGIN
jgi:hypothetical protein